MKVHAGARRERAPSTTDDGAARRSGRTPRRSTPATSSSAPGRSASIPATGQARRRAASRPRRRARSRTSPPCSRAAGPRPRRRRQDDASTWSTSRDVRGGERGLRARTSRRRIRRARRCRWRRCRPGARVEIEAIAVRRCGLARGLRPARRLRDLAASGCSGCRRAGAAPPPPTLARTRWRFGRHSALRLVVGVAHVVADRPLLAADFTARAIRGRALPWPPAGKLGGQVPRGCGG